MNSWMTARNSVSKFGKCPSYTQALEGSPHFPEEKVSLKVEEPGQEGHQTSCGAGSCPVGINRDAAGRQEVWWHLPEFPPSRLSPVQSNAPFPLFLPSHTVAILGGLSNCPEHPIGPSQLLSGRLSFLRPLQLLFGFKATPQTTPTRGPKLRAQFVTFMILLCPHRPMQSLLLVY